MAQSTLRYLDEEGAINFWNVPWKKLNRWLSALNGNLHVSEDLENVNRGSVIEELEQRRKGNSRSLKERGIGVFVDRGIGHDWREYENENGFTHLEELLIYQPPDWRKQAREYMTSLVKVHGSTKSETRRALGGRWRRTVCHHPYDDSNFGHFVSPRYPSHFALRSAELPSIVRREGSPPFSL